MAFGGSVARHRVQQRLAKATARRCDDELAIKKRCRLLNCAVPIVTVSSDPELLIEWPSRHVVSLRLNRPSKRNTLTMSLKSAIAGALDLAAADERIRALILTRGPDAFAGGTDISEMMDFTPADHLLRHTDIAWRALDRFPKPIIAAVNGVAFGGGCELALYAHLIIAGHSARFGQPEIKLGIMPGAGGSQKLLRAVGRDQAMRLVLLGEPIDATEAHRIGLVSELLPDDEVFGRAVAIGEMIAALPPLAVTALLETMKIGEDAPLSTALVLGKRAFQLLFATADQKEGMAAFLEKRLPVFAGA